MAPTGTPIEDVAASEGSFCFSCLSAIQGVLLGCDGEGGGHELATMTRMDQPQDLPTSNKGLALVVTPMRIGHARPRTRRLRTQALHNRCANCQKHTHKTLFLI
jgi:hypothetical protein